MGLNNHVSTKVLSFSHLLLFSALVFWIPVVNAKIGNFWHISDFHLDVNYSLSGNANDMCWDTGDASSSSSNKVWSRPGEFGNHLCDSPLKLVQSAIDEMQRIEPDPDFIMWTGDDTAHVDDRYFSNEKVLSTIESITDLLMESFANTTVYPVLGNHDYYPKSQLPPGMSEIQSGAAELWRSWLELDDDGQALDSFNTSGSYWMDVPDSAVSIVGLNTLLWYKNNHNVSQEDQDPGDQFQWLQNTLHDLAKRNRKVFVMGHIPPGTFERYQQTPEGFHWYQPKYNDRFIQIVVENADVIKGQFFAHHHTDSFRLFFKESSSISRSKRSDESRVPVSFQLLVPGVTPWKSSLSPETGSNNPGIRHITYDKETGQVLDVLTYYLDLDKANDGEATWELLYSFKDTYGLDAITPEGLYDVAKSLKSNRSTFDAYYRGNTVGYEDPDVCTEKCQRLHWCCITELNYEKFLECNGSTGRSVELTGWLCTTLLLLWYTLF